MGIKMDLGAADQQANSAKVVMAERLAAYDQLIAAIDLLLAADDLQGQAYGNTKNYAEGKLRPLANGAKALIRGIETTVDKPIIDYRAIFGDENLDEDELMRQIEAYNQTIERAQNLQEVLSKVNPLGATYSLEASAIVSSQISQYSAKRDQLQTKLDKLRTWAAGTATVLNEVDTLEDAVRLGFTEISQDFNRFGGSFPTIQNGQSPDWVKTINKYLEAEPQRLEAARQAPARQDARSVKDTEKAEVNFLKEYYQIIEDLTKPLTIHNNEKNIKRLMMLFSAYPRNVVNKIMKNDDFWVMAGKLSSSNQDRLINFLAGYESLGDTAAIGKWGPKINTIGKAFETYNKYVVSPIKGITSTLIKNSALYEKLAEKGSSAVKILGKVSTVLTFADLAVTGVSSGVNEYAKTQDIGRAGLTGSLDTIKSVGPLEGMTVGATAGSIIPGLGNFIGMVSGGVFGLVNIGAQFFFPKEYGNIRQAFYDFYDWHKEEKQKTVDSIARFYEKKHNIKLEKRE